LGIGREQAESVLRRSCELEASEFLEGCYIRFRSKRRIDDLVEIRGLDNLTAALEQGRGAILYSGHIRGQFSFFAALGAKGFKPNPVRLQLRSLQLPIRRWFGDRFNSLMASKFDCRFLWTERDSFGVAVLAANALRRNEVVNILIDLSFSAENAEVDFLGQPARFPLGPILLAQATGAPLLDYYVHRTDEWVPQIAEIGPALEVSAGTEATIQECARRLEERIRSHPADWGPWLIEDWKLFATWDDHEPWALLDAATNRA
jgi:KDO2-lipid IV(A) lauroyltransferase